MAYRLILIMSLIALLGLGGERLVNRKLDSIASISLPSSTQTWGNGQARDEDPSRLYFWFAHEYPFWKSMGSGTAFKQVLCVSLLAPNATAADYERWPPRFEPSYEGLKQQRTVTMGTARLAISSGRYAQNALDDPAHVYIYWDTARRLQIAWHVVDKVVAPDDAEQLIQRMAASFKLLHDPREKFIEMGGREGREKDRAAAAVRLAREMLTQAGFGAAVPGKPVYAKGVYVEWMQDPEPRYQLLKPLGLVRATGAHVSAPKWPGATGQRRPYGSIGWRRQVDGAWVSHNNDNDYLPLPGIENALAQRQTDAATTLYYYAATVRVEVADEATIAALGSFFEELPAVERAWQQGTLVSGSRSALPEASTPTASNTSDEASRLTRDPADSCERFCFGIDLQTGDRHLDTLRRRLATAAQGALPQVRAGNFDAADAAVLAVDRDIQSTVMLGAMYTEELRAAVANGESTSRPQFVAALHERALHWRLSAYPEPHTAHEADDYEAGRDADRAELAAMVSAK